MRSRANGRWVVLGAVGTAVFAVGLGTVVAEEHRHEGHAADTAAPSPAGPAAVTDQGTPTTVTGEITDATCYMRKGKDGLGPAHRDCAIRCIKEGRPPLVRDEQTGALYLATLPDSTPADREQWLKQIGNRVKVTGRVDERDGLRLLEVTEVKGEHDHDAAPHGGVVGMAGNRHLELVTTPANEIRVYVLDEFLQPLGVAGFAGTAVVKGSGGTQRSTVLRPDASNQFLIAQGVAHLPDDDTIDVSLRRKEGGEPLRMTLPFAAPGGDAMGMMHHHH